MRVRLTRLTALLIFLVLIGSLSPILRAVPGAVAPQGAGRLVFIGTYTGPTSEGIYAFRFDERSGALTPLGLAAATPNPSFLAISPDRRFLFAVNETAAFDQEKSGSVRSFSIDAATGKLTELSVQSSRGADPCHLAVDRTGRFLAVANYTGGNFALFPSGGRAARLRRARCSRMRDRTETARAGSAARACGRADPGNRFLPRRRSRHRSRACLSIRRGARHGHPEHAALRDGHGGRRSPAPGVLTRNGRQLFLPINEPHVDRDRVPSGTRTWQC
jgi:hypothetical protein